MASKVPLHVVGAGSLATCPRPGCRWERVLHRDDAKRTKEVEGMWAEHLAHHADPAAYVESVHATLTPEALEVGGVNLPNVHSLVGAIDAECQHWRDVAVRLATLADPTVVDPDEGDEAASLVWDDSAVLATIREEMAAAGVIKQVKGEWVPA